MSTVRFSKAEFEKVLDDSILGTDLSWSCAGIVSGEYRYVSQLADHVFLQINSSVLSDGFAAGTGDNSIRLWLTDEKLKPVAKKTQRWVTRLPGWERRLDAAINAVVALGKAVHSKQKQKVEETAAKVSMPSCPKCGGMMAVRTRKSDGKQFYGCRMFPACNGTRDIDWNKTVTVEQVVTSTEHKWSHLQIAIFNKIPKLADSCHLVVEALAGTGKTTTIAQSTKLLPREKKIVVLAFNRHNIPSIKEKVPEWVKVCTYHSLAFAGCRKVWGGDIVVDEDKVDHIIENILNRDVYKYLFGTIRQIVSLVKANLTGTSPEELLDIAGYYGIELNGDAEIVFATVAQVISRCAATTKVIDYDDMCWLPIVHNVQLEKYDYVYVDEAQDTNRNQMAIALASVSPTGHIIAVGDRYQSMYGFRGADANAIPNLINDLGAEVLPLSITYRNPQCVVDLVREKFPNIPLEGTGKAGSITYTTDQQAIVMYKAGDMVLCRTNAPLVAPVFALIRNGIKATIRGRDIGKGLTSLIKKMKAKDLTDLIRKLGEYQNKEYSKLIAADKNSAAQALKDKVETIIALSDGVYAISELEERISTIFSDKVEGVVFSTIHRAKGLESERVFILHPELLPHPMAKKEWEKEQERNIEYVALTRTLSELIWVLEA
jgi:ssDNA-binding Zn-finger/Zn-ribbon topoisomerase 1